MRFALIACRSTPTNQSIARAVGDGSSWELMTPEEALDVLRPGDAALGRLDVLASLDGVDDGLWALGALEARGVTVLNTRQRSSRRMTSSSRRGSSIAWACPTRGLFTLGRIGRFRRCGHLSS